MARELLQIRVTATEKGVFRRAAAAGGLNISAWARMKLRLAAVADVADAGRALMGADVPRETSPEAGSAADIPRQVSPKYDLGSAPMGAAMPSMTLEIPVPLDVPYVHPRQRGAEPICPACASSNYREGACHSCGFYVSLTSLTSMINTTAGASDLGEKINMPLPAEIIATTYELIGRPGESGPGAVGGPSDTGGEYNPDPAAAEPGVDAGAIFDQISKTIPPGPWSEPAEAPGPYEDEE